jgi:mRNA interferase RelE/StbE
MASYQVVLKPSVEKDLRSLPKSVIQRALNEIEALGEDPFPRQSLKLEGGEGLYRVRVGDYRLVYGVDKVKKTVLVHYVRHRREVYRKL